MVPRLTAQIDALQANPVLRNQPATIAQLERVRVLADGLRRDLRGLSQGSAKAAAQSSAMLDSDMAITQVVRGLAEGNAELGLRALTGPEAIRALDGLRKESAELSKTLRDVLASGDRLSALRQSMEQLDTLVGALPVKCGQRGAGPDAGSGCNHRCGIARAGHCAGARHDLDLPARGRYGPGSRAADRPE